MERIEELWKDYGTSLADFCKIHSLDINDPNSEKRRFSYWKYCMWEQGMLEAAFEGGYEIGYEIGKKLGLAEVLGPDYSIEVRKGVEDVVEHYLKKSYTLDKISEISGLTVAEIEQIANRMYNNKNLSISA